MAIVLNPGDLYYLQRGGAILQATYKGRAGGSAHWFNIEGHETFLYESEFVVLGVQEPLS